MKVAVVGGAGYIGSHTVYELIKNGHDVIVIDDLSKGHLEAVHKDARFYKGNIKDRAFLNDVFSKENTEDDRLDGVIHFAAYSLVGESMVEPLKYYENNIYGTAVLLDVMKDHDIKRIVFSSTAAVYGQPPVDIIDEETEKQPLNTYGQTKLDMEHMLSWCEKAYGFKYMALRYFNAAGAIESGEIGEDHSPETHLIPLVMQAALGKREFISIFGTDYNTPDGTCVRDYIHVTDLARAHIKALEYIIRENRSNVCNLGNGNGFSVKEIIENTEAVIGRTIPKKFGERRPGDPDILVASNKKAKEILGWEPQYTDIKDILRTAYNWHSSHPEGY